jgi:hypothetical protein
MTISDRLDRLVAMGTISPHIANAYLDTLGLPGPTPPNKTKLEAIETFLKKHEGK